MGILNLLKGSFTGKVGQMVGAKWKNKSTIRSYTKPAYTATPAQQIVRAGFAEMTSFTALFADQIKSLSALNTKGMSVRNAIIKLNKEMITEGELTPSNLLVSRGGLPNVEGMAITKVGANAGIKAEWTKKEGATISDKARVVLIAVSQEGNFALAGFALNEEEELTLTAELPATGIIHCYYYLLDYRGSSRVASPSAYTSV
jgi:hypothetical protein